MKKLIAITALTSGVLLLLVPRFILPACEHEGYPRMHCSDTARAEYIAGALLMALGGIAFYFLSARAMIAGAAAALILYITSFLLPDIFGYCHSTRMPCNYGMVPGIRLIAVAGAVIMIIAVISLIRAIRKKGNS